MGSINIILRVMRNEHYVQSLAQNDESQTCWVEKAWLVSTTWPKTHNSQASIKQLFAGIGLQCVKEQNRSCTVINLLLPLRTRNFLKRQLQACA